ncbi:MAG: hypothetical protein JKY60_11170, partial [Kordiimonadaceae bacterium]|nr:hypothetical protein [Kordiimonadaceae bacterium]
MGGDVRVVGVGMIPFKKPGVSDGYQEMGAAAVRAALEDAGIGYDHIQQAYCGYVYGDSTCGQAVVYKVGLTGIPIINVNNNCSTGSTALYLARQAVQSGAVDCALAVGFEEMEPGALGTKYMDRVNPMAAHMQAMMDLQDFSPTAPVAAQLFGGAGGEYAAKHGTRLETFAKIAEKSRKHAAHNSYAIFREPLTVDEIISSPTQYGMLTRFQCCPPTCGAAAAIVCTPEFAAKHGLDATVRIAAQAMATDPVSTFEGKSMMNVVGYSMSKSAADQCYEQAGIGPKDIGVVELHDCFTANELITYESLGIA